MKVRAVKLFQIHLHLQPPNIGLRRFQRVTLIHKSFIIPISISLDESQDIDISVTWHINPLIGMLFEIQFLFDVVSQEVPNFLIVNLQVRAVDLKK